MIQIDEHELAQLRHDAQAFHTVMECLQDMKLEHGLCKPRSRQACTHCNAKDLLQSLLSGYQSPPIVQSRR